MTDREKMIEVISKCVVKTTASYIADRLIEAGFGVVKGGPIFPVYDEWMENN